MKINKEILQDVKLPARYVGGEFNQVKKHRNVDLNIVLCYPAFYEDGMSSYEFRYIYSLLIIIKMFGVQEHLCQILIW